jgi:hypothetical protein
MAGDFLKHLKPDNCVVCISSFPRRVCPNCGYCPYCGTSTSPVWPIWPVWPKPKPKPVWVWSRKNSRTPLVDEIVI